MSTRFLWFLAPTYTSANAALAPLAATYAIRVWYCYIRGGGITAIYRALRKILRILA